VASAIGAEVETGRPKEALKTVERSLGLIEALAEEGSGYGLSEISRKLRLNKAVAYRILLTLMHHGYVVQDPVTRRYTLGIKLFELGSTVVNRTGLRKVALGPMGELGRLCRETINLAVLDGNEAVYLDRIECAAPLRADLQVGRRVPSYCSALGKVLLAYLPSEERETVLSTITFQRYTPRTIADPDQLRKHLEDVREAGFSLDDEEYIPGVRCLGAPVFNHHGRAVAAVSIAGPSVRLVRERILALVEPLKATAEAISRNLGYLPGTSEIREV
jgi:IclR family acetate operon transcriptional repressor